MNAANDNIVYDVGLHVRDEDGCFIVARHPGELLLLYVFPDGSGEPGEHLIPCLSGTPTENSNDDEKVFV